MVVLDEHCRLGYSEIERRNSGAFLVPRQIRQDINPRRFLAISENGESPVGDIEFRRLRSGNWWRRGRLSYWWGVQARTRRARHALTRVRRAGSQTLQHQLRMR